MLLCGWQPALPAPLTVASKAFTESVILGEILRQLAASEQATVRHQRQLGGTRIVWNALQHGEIDAYVEYTGTLRQEIFNGQTISDPEQLRQRLADLGLVMSQPLGFNNTYALATRADIAAARGWQAISDLRSQPQLRLGFSSEFIDRADGWAGLRQFYQLPQDDVRGLSHDLAYRGLISGALDVIDVYTTDAEIAYYQLQLLTDDRGFFPDYEAVIVYRQELHQQHPAVVSAWNQLNGAIDAAAMRQMNAGVKLEQRSEQQVAAEFVATLTGKTVVVPTSDNSLLSRFWRHTRDHLQLVVISLGGAILVAVPLGIIAARRPRLGKLILGASGILQTLPSLALFVFLIPLLGIGAQPAIAALFLYSLLPIVRNTHAGLSQVDPALRDSARVLGLSSRYRLWRIELPLASPTIMAGIQTSAVINVGTATLAALIGAGGYGQPIITGIRLDNLSLIMEGAIPAALLALAAQALFHWLERWLVPAGLRQPTKQRRQTRH
ncbi:MAG: glycine betaine ABC transporter substrate-binding protein [Wenzhouxiangellaceae bacterium]